MSKSVLQPNPCRNEIHLTADLDHDYTLVIKDLFGKLVFLHTYPSRHKKISLTTVPAGSYVFMIRTNSQTFEERITIIK